MNKILKWGDTHSNEITWFVIGLLTSTCLDALSRGSYIVAAFSAALICINYLLNKK